MFMSLPLRAGYEGEKLDNLVGMLRAAGDPTRLRLLLILRQAELTVSELVELLAQSQPRISRHLKLLCDAGLIARFKESSWVFYRASDDQAAAQFNAMLSDLEAREPGVHAADLQRLGRIRDDRAAKAAAYFKANAAEWGRIRALHAPDKEVEAALVRLLASRPIENLLDAGTGTGRMLELLAPYTKRAMGLDTSPDMLAIARDRMMKPEFTHCQVRLGNIYQIPLSMTDSFQGFDAILFHQVLHYLDDPQAAIMAAAQTLRPGGRVLVADFAPHQLEFLRTDFAHRRLGFADDEVQGWFKAAGLKLVSSEGIAPRGAAKNKLTVKIWLAASKAAGKAGTRDAA